MTLEEKQSDYTLKERVNSSQHFLEEKCRGREGKCQGRRSSREGVPQPSLVLKEHIPRPAPSSQYKTETGGLGGMERGETVVEDVMYERIIKNGN